MALDRSRAYPLPPLLAAFRASSSGAIDHFAHSRLLTVAFLDTASDVELATNLNAVAETVLPVTFHGPTLARRVRFLRHGLNHLFRAADPLPDRLARCVTPGDPYFVSGLGPGFWSAVATCVETDRVPRWC